MGNDHFCTLYLNSTRQINRKKRNLIIVLIFRLFSVGFGKFDDAQHVFNFLNS